MRGKLSSYQALGLLLLALVMAVTLSVPSALAEDIVVRNGDRSKPRIAITLDDCYNAEHVREALEICQKYEVPVTFFVIGKALKYKDAALWQEVVDSGCEIGNHTWGHQNLTRVNAHQIRFHLWRTQEKVDALLGYHYPMQVMRPPLGKVSGGKTPYNVIVEAIASAGYLRAVKWDVSQTDPDKALKDTQNGSILLFHTNVKDIRCLDELIPALKDAGFTLCTVSDLLELPPIATSTDLYVYDKSQNP